MELVTSESQHAVHAHLGLVDAAVMVTCEQLGETKVATLDRRIADEIAATPSPDEVAAELEALV